MNTRSQTRACAAASSSQAAATTASRGRMGIRFRNELQHDLFSKINNREVKATKWACPVILNQFGVSNDFNLLCNRVGLQNFAFHDVPTYHRLNLEFLSSLTSNIKTWH